MVVAEYQGSAQQQEYDNLINENQKAAGNVSKKDFEMISVIGKGSYGKVMLVKKRDTG
jgi:serum/glucocorticoid-regulated kinase 2